MRRGVGAGAIAKKKLAEVSSHTSSHFHSNIPNLLFSRHFCSVTFLYFPFLFRQGTKREGMFWLRIKLCR